MTQACLKQITNFMMCCLSTQPPSTFSTAQNFLMTVTLFSHLPQYQSPNLDITLSSVEDGWTVSLIPPVNFQKELHSDNKLTFCLYWFSLFDLEV